LHIVDVHGELNYHTSNIRHILRLAVGNRILHQSNDKVQWPHSELCGGRQPISPTVNRRVSYLFGPSRSKIRAVPRE